CGGGVRSVGEASGELDGSGAEDCRVGAAGESGEAGAEIYAAAAGGGDGTGRGDGGADYAGALWVDAVAADDFSGGEGVEAGLGVVTLRWQVHLKSRGVSLLR